MEMFIIRYILTCLVNQVIKVKIQRLAIVVIINHMEMGSWIRADQRVAE